jgi:hypothetical protein
MVRKVEEMAKKQTRKAMSAPDQRRLWVYAHGLCNNPDCRRLLIIEPTDQDSATTTGYAAHMVAHSLDGPRGEGGMQIEDRETYENMILLCGDCHRKIDGQPNTHPVEMLQAWKDGHETWVAECIQRGMTAIEFKDLEEVTNLFARQTPSGSSPTVAPDIAAKIKKNRLTEKSVKYLSMGVAGSSVAGSFIHDLERTRPGIGQRVRAGFLVHYNQGILDQLHPDDIFMSLMGVASNHSADFDRQAAGLAVLGYLFTTCEVFES